MTAGGKKFTEQLERAYRAMTYHQQEKTMKRNLRISQDQKQKKNKIIRMIVAFSILVLCHSQSLRAATLGCTANGLSPVYGVDYGTSLGAETWHVIEGDPLKIAAGSLGGIAAWVCQPSGVTRQYFGEASWGTNIWLDGTNSLKLYNNSYHGNGTDFTAGASHTKTVVGSTTTIETTLVLGVDAELKRVITYTDGDYFYQIRWELTNNSGGTFSDIRLIHGGDTYFGGVDSARSWWDSERGMIYINNNNFANSGIMGFFGSQATPASHYYGGNYGTGNSQANTSGRLDDTADSNFVDAGYQLEWDKSSLANGDTWVIEAYEFWTDPTPVQVLAPESQLSEDGSTVGLEFGIHNLDSSQRTFSLSALSSLGWTLDLPGGSSVTIDALASVTVQVHVTIPDGLAIDTISMISITASDGSGSGSSSTSIRIFSPDYTITPSTLSFGNISVGSNSTSTITLTNSGSDVVVGTVASPNNLASPFTITADNCSGQTIGNGASCTIDVKFQPSSEVSSSDTFNIPILSPVVTSKTISTSGTGTLEEIHLKLDTTGIADGGSYGFGSKAIGSDTDIIFTIMNQGTGDLELTTPLSITGTNADQFSIHTQPSSPVPASGSTTFTVRFSPESAGTKTSAIAIANSDGNENPYNLTITGTGTAPEIALSQGATPISDGDSHNFGSQSLSSSTDVEFTITNSGNANLTLATPLIIGGSNADQFTVQAQPASPVTGSGSTTFTIRFSPDSAGAKTASFAITNNDSDENPYNITFSGSSFAAPLVSTGAAKVTGIDGAILKGTANACNKSTAVSFEYGLTLNYGSTIPADQGTVTGESDTSVTKTLSGLAPGTEYHYRIIATNSTGTSHGNDQIFKTEEDFPWLLFMPALSHPK